MPFSFFSKPSTAPTFKINSVADHEKHFSLERSNSGRIKNPPGWMGFTSFSVPKQPSRAHPAMMNHTQSTPDSSATNN